MQSVSLRLTVLFLAVQLAPADAHFIWLRPVPEKQGTVVQVYFGEEAAADDPALLARLKSLQVLRVTSREAPKPIGIKLNDKSLSATVNDYRGRSLFIATHDLGVFERGESIFRLKYYAKGGPAVTHSSWQRINCTEHLRLDVVPSFEEGNVTVAVRFDGKPVAGVEVKAAGPGLDDFGGTTNDRGEATFKMADAGVYSIRARHIEATAGELDGKSYPETRHYSTVAVDVPELPPYVTSRTIAMVPQEITSFGAAITDGFLYTYGGHTGDAHSYSREEQANTLMRMDLRTGKWKALAKGPNLQGLALVTRKGRLYALADLRRRTNRARTIIYGRRRASLPSIRRTDAGQSSRRSRNRVHRTTLQLLATRSTLSAAGPWAAMRRTAGTKPPGVST